MSYFKKFTTVALSLMLMMSTVPAYAEGESADYSDYVPGQIPENLIISSGVLNNNGGNARFGNITGGGYKYTVTENTRTGAWNVFPPSALIAENSGGNGTINLDYFKAGATYVYTAKVKNASEDTALTPYYGIAIPAKNSYSYFDAVGSNEYGNDGMPITSTEWTDFKATITFPENWNEASKDGAVGQKIFAGVGKKSDLNSSLIIDSTVGDSLYLAEEVPYNITVTGEKESLNCNESVDLTCEIVNQIDLCGKLNQDVSWYVVNSERTEKEDGFTITEKPDGVVTVSVSEDTEYGTYYVIAESEDYEGFRKGYEIEVKKPPLQDYVPGEAEEEGENYIQNPSNSGFATASSGDVKVTAGDGYVTLEAINDIESELGVEGLKVRTVGSNGLPSTFNFEPGKAYAVKARVRNSDPETEVYFNASISNSTAETLSLTAEYGREGMLLTDEWQEFGASILVSETYDKDAAASKRTFVLGFSNGTPAGTKIDIELSVLLSDISVYDIILKADENIVLGAEDCFEAEAAVVDTLGSPDGILQEFEWYLLDNEKVNRTDALKIEVSEDTKKAKVITDIYSQADTYYLVCESKNYDGFIRSIKFEVDKPSAEECIKEILKNAEEEILSENLEEYISFLKLETAIEDVNYETLAGIIVESRSRITDENMQDFLKKAIVIAAYEDADSLYDSEGEFKYADELNLKELDKDGATIYSLFENEISKDGKIKLQKALEGKYESFEEFEKAFMVEVILKAIEHPAKSGLGILELILTEENADAAGIKIDEYLDLEEKIDAAEHILKKEFTKEQLEKAIADIKDTIRKENNKGSGNSSSGSGSGGGYSKPSSIVIAPGITNNTGNEDAKPEDTQDNEVQMFKDVSEEHWAYREIYYLNRIDVISGVGEGLFNPDETVTREQFVKMLCEAFEYEISNESCEFSDVLKDAWYEKYIVTAVKKGIITGIGDGSFGVGKSITREDMAVIINRAMGENSMDEIESDFLDFDTVSEYAKGSVTYLNSIGVINGFDDGSFRPKDKCTRAQAAKIICTILNLKEDE